MTKIEFIRRMNGLSQAQVAQRLGIAPAIVSQMEKKYRKPYPKFRRAVAALYELGESELFGPDGWPLEVELTARKLG